MAESQEPKKRVKVVGAHSFHLRAGKNHFPTINLGSGKDTDGKIDFDMKKVSWVRSYLKTGAVLSTDQRNADPNALAYWQNLAEEQNGKKVLTDRLTQQLGRAPNQAEIDAGWESRGPALLKEVRQDPTSVNMMSAINRQIPDVDALRGANVRNFQAQQANFDAMSPDQQQLYKQPVIRDPGRTDTGYNPDLLNNAASRAAGDRAQFVGNQGTPGQDTGIGAAGTMAPLTNALPGIGRILGDAVPAYLGDGEALGPSAQIDAHGNPVANVDSDVPAAARATESNAVADLTHDYNAAVQNGDTAKADAVAEQIRTNQGASPTDIARGAVARSDVTTAAHGLGSQAFNAGMVPAGMSAQPGFAGALRGAPLAAGIQALLPAAVAAWQAPWGKKLDAVGQVAPGAVNNAVRSGATTAAMTAALPAMGGVGGATYMDRIRSAMNGLRTATPGVTSGTGLRAGAGNLLVAGTLASGVNSLGRLYDHYTSDDAAAADNTEVRNQVLANEGLNKTQKFMNAAGAGGQILLGNVGPAARQFGAAVAPFAPNTPAGRNRTEALRDAGAVTAGSDARSQALAALQRDDRFRDMDPNILDHLAEQASRQGESAAQLNYGKGPNEEVTPQPLQQYSQARTAQAAGKATPEQLGFLSELAGEPIAAGTPMTGAQQQQAGSNATLYHHFGAGAARQLMQGNLPYHNTQGVPSVAPGAIVPAVGVPAAPKPVTAPVAKAPMPAAPAGPIKPIQPVPKVAADIVGDVQAAAPTPPAAPPMSSPKPAAPMVPTAPATPMSAQPAPKLTVPTAPMPTQAPGAGTTVVAPPAAVPSDQALTPAQPKIDYKQLAGDLVSKRSPEAVQAYVDWSNGASPEERAAGRDAILQSGGGALTKGLSMFGLDPFKGMTDEQKNKMIVDKFRQAGTGVGNDISAAATKEWSANGGGLGGYLMQNPTSMLLPVGLMLAMTGGAKTKMLGLMAAAGGAYNLFSRYRGVTDPTFLKAVQDRVMGQKAGTWGAESEADFGSKYGTAWKDLQAAQAGGLVNIPQQAGNAAADMIGKALPGYKAPGVGAAPIPAQAAPPPPATAPVAPAPVN